MKRVDLLRKIRKAATGKGKPLVFVRSGANHDIYEVGQTRFPVARHSEIGKGLVDVMGRELEAELGKDWWR